MWKRAVALSAAVPLLLAACSSSGGEKPATSAAGGGAPTCSSLYGDADWSAHVKRANMCAQPDGGMLVLAYFNCKDGSRLYQFEVGKASYYGVSTGRLVKAAGPAAQDPRYAHAVTACGQA